MGGGGNGLVFGRDVVSKKCIECTRIPDVKIKHSNMKHTASSVLAKWTSSLANHNAGLLAIIIIRKRTISAVCQKMDEPDIH